MTKHKWYDEIVAWADGAEIEHLYGSVGWVEDRLPAWHPTEKYRIKPKSKANVEVYYCHLGRVTKGWFVGRIITPEDTNWTANTKCTFDGVTGEYLSVEKI